MTRTGHDEREALREEIVGRMRGLDVSSISGDSFRALQAELGLDIPDVTHRQFRRAITGAHYKRDGRLHLGRVGRESMGDPAGFVLTCLA